MDHVIRIISQNLVELDELRQIPKQSVFHAIRGSTGQSRGDMWHESACHVAPELGTLGT